MSSWRDTPPEEGDEAPPIPALEPIMPTYRDWLIAAGLLKPAPEVPILTPIEPRRGRP